MSLDPGAARTALQAGNDAYGRGDYGAAVAAYEQALAAGADSADVLHNLGNALYRAGQMGRAALAYERALRREPSHELARHNLQLVRAQGRDAALVGAEPFFLRLGQRVDPDLAGAGLLGGWYLFAGLLLARRRVAAGIPRLALLVAALVALALASASGVATWASHRVREGGWSVVVADEASVREQPEGEAKVAFQVHEGLKVRQAGRVAGFAKIELPSGLSGWVEAGALERIDAP